MLRTIQIPTKIDASFRKRSINSTIKSIRKHIMRITTRKRFCWAIHSRRQQMLGSNWRLPLNCPAAILWMLFRTYMKYSMTLKDRSIFSLNSLQRRLISVIYSKANIRSIFPAAKMASRASWMLIFQVTVPLMILSTSGSKLREWTKETQRLRVLTYSPIIQATIIAVHRPKST